MKWTDSTGMEPDGGNNSPVIYIATLAEVVVSAKSGNSAGNAGVTKPEQLGVPASDNTSVYANTLDYNHIHAPQDKYMPASIPTMGPDLVPPEVRAMYRRERAYNEMQERNRTLDPFAYDLARSPGVQAGMALVVPGYGEAAGGAQMYSGFKTGNKADVILGGLSVGLGGYSSLRGVLNEGRFIKPGSLNAANGAFRNPLPSQAKSTVGEIAGAGNAAKTESRFIADGAGNVLDTKVFQGLQEVNAVVKGGRGGTQLPLFGKSGIFANFGNGHKIVYGADGRALFDVSVNRIKGIQWNQAPNGNWFPMKSSGTKFQGPVPQSVLNALGF